MKDIVSLERMLEKLYEWVITRGVNVFFGIIFLSIGWKVINKTLKRIRRILESKNADQTITRFLDNVMNVTLKTVLIIIILQYSLCISCTLAHPLRRFAPAPPKGELLTKS